MQNTVVLKLCLDYWTWFEQIAKVVYLWDFLRFACNACQIHNPDIFSPDHLFFLNYIFPTTWKVSFDLEEEFDEFIRNA